MIIDMIKPLKMNNLDKVILSDNRVLIERQNYMYIFSLPHTVMASSNNAAKPPEKVKASNPINNNVQFRPEDAKKGNSIANGKDKDTNIRDITGSVSVNPKEKSYTLSKLLRSRAFIAGAAFVSAVAVAWGVHTVISGQKSGNCVITY